MGVSSAPSIAAAQTVQNLKGPRLGDSGFRDSNYGPLPCRFEWDRPVRSKEKL